MPELQGFPLVTTSGRKGRVYRASRFLDRSNVNRVAFDDGNETTVLASDLRVQPDGSFVMDDGAESSEPESPRVPVAAVPAPPPEQPARAAAPAPPDPARGRTKTAGNEVRFDEPLFTEDVNVERVPVNRLLDGPAQTRQEGDTTIIPVVEEVITVQKRLFLREEVRITRKRVEVREPRRIRMDGEKDRVVGADGRDIDLS